MKKLMMVIMTVLLFACGNGDSPIENIRESVKVKGDIYNINAFKPLASMVIVLNSISAGQIIEVSTVIINDGTVALENLTYEIQIEDTTFLTSEYWCCSVMYNDFDSGNYGFEVWTVHEEPLPICEGQPKDPMFDCWTYSITLDCVNPLYEIYYQPHGDGLWKASGQINSLAINEIFTTSVGYGNTGIDVRSAHMARWIVVDEDGKELARQEYLFDVVP